MRRQRLEGGQWLPGVGQKSVVQCASTTELTLKPSSTMRGRATSIVPIQIVRISHKSEAHTMRVHHGTRKERAQGGSKAFIGHQVTIGR